MRRKSLLTKLLTSVLVIVFSSTTNTLPISNKPFSLNQLRAISTLNSTAANLAVYLSLNNADGMSSLSHPGANGDAEEYRNKISLESLANYSKARGLGVERIHRNAFRIIDNEAAALGTDNIEWVLRSIFGKTTDQNITNVELEYLFVTGKIKTEFMLFKPQLRPGDIPHSERLKKDLPIKACNRAYSPVIGEALVSSMLENMRRQVDVDAIVSRCEKQGKQLVVVGKYSGGLVPGILVANALGLPFLALTKRPLDFDIDEPSSVVVDIKEPQLPAHSPELSAHLLANTNIAVIFVDDESTTGKVNTNTIKALRKAGIDTELVVVFAQTTDEAEIRMHEEEPGIPYVYLNAIYSDKRWNPRHPILVPFADAQVSTANSLPKPEADGTRSIPFKLRPLKDASKNAVFVDHPFRGMGIMLEPAQFSSVSKWIGEILEEKVGIQELRRSYYEKGKTLYIVGTTPSGLYAGLAASQSTRTPLLGATNRPQPLGFENTADYVGSEGFNYSIHGVVKGDGIVLVTGELTDGEEQIRIIKSLRDRGIDVIRSFSVMENISYNGRERLSRLGIPVHSLQTYQANEAIDRINICKKAQGSLIYAINELERAAKGVNPNARVMKVEVSPGRFAKGIMMDGDYIDDTYVCVEGISQTELNRLRKRFVAWLNREDIVFVDKKSKCPMLISADRIEAIKKRYGLSQLPLITIYENGRFKTTDKALEESNISLPRLHAEDAARIRILLTLGELDINHAKSLLSKINDKHDNHYKELLSALENRAEATLSEKAKGLFFALDDLYLQGKFEYTIPAGEEVNFENTLYELCSKGLIYIRDNKLVLVWRSDNPEWSKEFWQAGFKVLKNSPGEQRLFDAENLLARVRNKLLKGKTDIGRLPLVKTISSDNPILAESTIRYAGLQSNISEETAKSIIERLGGPLFVSVAAFEIIRAHRDWFDTLVKESLQDLVFSKELDGHFNLSRHRLELMLRAIFAWVDDKPQEADQLMGFVYEHIIKGNEVVAENIPNSILQLVIEHLGKAYFNLRDNKLKREIGEFLILASYGYHFEKRDSARNALKNIGDDPIIKAIPKRVKGAGRLTSQVVTKERKALFSEMEKRRLLHKPIDSIIADLDDSLLTYRPESPQRINPEISFWLNWLKGHGTSVAINTGSDYERLYDKTMSEDNPIPIKPGPNFHAVTDAGAFYNDKRIPYRDIPYDMEEYISFLMSKDGWHKIDDGRIPNMMFVKPDLDLQATYSLASNLSSYFKALGYDYDIAIGQLPRPANYWTIKIYPIDKTYIFSQRPDIRIRPQTTLLLFDDGGEFGTDRALVDWCKGGLKVNLGNEVRDSVNIHQLKIRGEDGARLAIEALVASTIMRLISEGEDWKWQGLEEELKQTGIFDRSDISAILAPIRKLITEQPRISRRKKAELTVALPYQDRAINIGITGTAEGVNRSLTRYLLRKNYRVTVLEERKTIEKDEQYFGNDATMLSMEQADIFSKAGLERIVAESSIIYHIAKTEEGQKLEEAEILAVKAFGTALLAEMLGDSNFRPRVIFVSDESLYDIEDSADINGWLDKIEAEFKKQKEVLFALPDAERKSKIIDFCRRVLESYPLPEGFKIEAAAQLMGERFIKKVPDAIVARASNIYGPECQNNNLIQRLVENRFSGKLSTERNEVGDYIYIDDFNSVVYELGRRKVVSPAGRVDIVSGRKASASEIWEHIERFTKQSRGGLKLIKSDKSIPESARRSEYAEHLLGRSFTYIETGTRNIIDELLYRDKIKSTKENATVVFDIGGTYIRTGIFYQDGVLEIISKEQAPNYRIHSDLDIQGLHSELIEFMKRGVKKARAIAETQGITINRVGVSFPGPVIGYSVVDRASTLWGEKSLQINLAERIQEDIPGIKGTYILHDIDADVIRYAVEKNVDRFGVITVSSGVNCSIYDREKGGLTTDEYGLMGQLGHLLIDYSDSAPRCECGEKGHLAALASGRAAERILREEARADIDGFKKSRLYAYSGGDVKNLNNILFEMALKDNDEWALKILDRLTKPLAVAINHIATITGVRDFYLVGGFAVGIGDIYLESLFKQLSSIRLLHRDPSFFKGHIRFGYTDDADGMKGVGYFAQLQEKKQHKLSEVSADDGYVLKRTTHIGAEATEAYAPTEIRYSNYFTRDVFSENNNILKDLCAGRKVFMVVDETVYNLWGEAINRYVETKALDCTIYTIPGGEKVKDMEYVTQLCARAKSLGMDRKALFVAIGGGTVMDVVGVAAQLYRRHVDCIRIPTTLLGIVDAGLGVKVGVNFGGSKNFLGAFNPPMAIISDSMFLRTLPKREVASGLAEIIKVALISNAQLFEQMEEYSAEMLEHIDSEKFMKFVEDGGIELLRHIQRDFCEYNLMLHVDLGHAMAHHFEMVTKYELTHGEAVAIDILIAAHIARDRGILSKGDFKRIVELHRRLGLPFFHAALTVDAMWEGIEKTIRHKGGRLMTVVPKRIGQTVFIDSLSKEELTKALGFLQDLHKQHSHAEQLYQFLINPVHKAPSPGVDNRLIYALDASA